MHFGATTTQCVESAHLAMKCAIKTSGTYLCESRVNNNVLCQHLFPNKGFVMLSIIPKRWLLFPNKDQAYSNFITKNASLTNKQQKSTLLKSLDDILAVPETKLSEIKILEKITEKGCPSETNWLPTALEYQICNPKSDSNYRFRALAIAIRGNENN
ncbi:29390_t:CDS:2 [Gigaspora margarita]|uniref:29390_t:CDS:1 n=1 Tax=Gigaspora margarita TaxID=4874 RepID=A0ABN7VIT6_GIGMA|nr:29390_t:CDS:2 [Gigaspora margarita]